VGVALVIVYGSLVPFDLKSSDGLNPYGWLEQIRFTPWARLAHTDLAVNVAVGAWLGFFLMGASLRAHRRGALAAAVALTVVACLPVILGTAVEMLQVLSPTRNSSWNDVAAQGFGAVVGALVWTLFGPAVILWLRHLANEGDSSEFAACLLPLYLLLYLILQLTPFDTVRAAELAANYERGGITQMPPTYGFESAFHVLRSFGGNALLSTPIGALAALSWVRRGRRRVVGSTVLLGVLIFLAVRVAQEFMWSRHTRVSDVLAGTLGVLIGIAIAKWLAPPRVREPARQARLVHPWFLVAAGAWTLVLVLQGWMPFDFELTSEIVKRRLTRTSVVPFAFYYWYASYQVDPLQALHEALLTFLLAIPLGLFLQLAWPVAGERRDRRLRGVASTVAATTVLLVIEVGQTFLPMRFPDVTDVLIGVIGAIVGSAIGQHVLARDRRRWVVSVHGRC
jgi:VanZ family protein